jgi:hypothetical protein
MPDLVVLDAGGGVMMQKGMKAKVLDICILDSCALCVYEGGLFSATTWYAQHHATVMAAACNAHWLGCVSVSSTTVVLSKNKTSSFIVQSPGDQCAACNEYMPNMSCLMTVT